jgi:predicted nucleotidyltransferase
MGHDRGVVLARFVDACVADDRIVAAFLAGSHATGTADAYSDLDLGVITTDASFADVLADRRALVGQLGEPLFLDHLGRTWNVFFILADGTEGEIFFGREGALDEIDVGPFESLLDKRGILAGAEFLFSPPDPDAQREHLRQSMNWFWHELAHFVAALRSGRPLVGVRAARGAAQPLRQPDADPARRRSAR